MTRRLYSKLRMPLWLSAYADLFRQRRAAARYRAENEYQGNRYQGNRYQSNRYQGNKHRDSQHRDNEYQSRVYQRLKASSLEDRFFYRLRQRRRDRFIEAANTPSYLHQRLQSKHRQRQRRKRLVTALLGIGLGSALWTGLFVSERITLGGVPYRVIKTFWDDETARTAYFSGDAQALHDQLSSLGVEESIKAYYRDRFDNEYELDRHIHQIMFERTGYVGEAYEVDTRGQLY